MGDFLCMPKPSPGNLITSHEYLRGAGAWVIQQRIEEEPWEPTEWYYGRDGLCRLSDWDNTRSEVEPQQQWFYPDLIEELRCLNRNRVTITASYSAQPTSIEFRGYNLVTKDMCYL